ncbi:MAG: protein kinase [Planctomycetia bacterium]|nr:protein kinase [Planctomycetia bacterium]
MPRESDLLFGVLALQMNFISKEQLVEAAAVCMGDASKDLGRLLRERGHLRDFQHAAVSAMVEAQLRTNGGDSGKTLAIAAADPQVADTLRTVRMPPPPPAPREPAPAAPPHTAERYRLGEKLGAGGLGEVLAAFDASLEREVAIKVIRGNAPGDQAERFARESKLAGSLEHPHIVPVYDFGSLGSDGKRLYLAMKRIRGRDLGKVLSALAAGDEEARREFTRTRLLQIFQDVCLGMAYAHDRGVIHRDLKPANIMLGDYGEVYVVDWGLARKVGTAPEPAARAAVPAASAQLTLDGEIMGTPSYMSPEQADGRIQELDRRTDVYSLGAVLHEILTLRPPFEGKTAVETIRKVKLGGVAPPSRAPAAGSAPIPPELDAICLRALSLRPGDRFQSALELHHEIQLFLEGAKTREREHRLAEEAVGRARGAMERRQRLAEAAKAAAARAKEVERGLGLADPDKSALWAAQDRAKSLERESVEAFAEAVSALTVALSHEKDHAEARRLRAGLAWEKFLEAEARRDENEMVLRRREVELYDDGDFARLLRGDGALTLRTRAYPCRCLMDGREVRPEELARRGFHPFSGRNLGDPVGEPMDVLEPSAPVRLRVHGAACEPRGVDGARVWAYRYEEVGRRLVPVTPVPGEPGESAQPLVAKLFAPDSPYRPQGPGLYLGRTPVTKRALPMGSWLLLVECDGFEPVRCPFVVPRCSEWVQELTLWRPCEIPDGFLPVAEGRFTWQGDPDFRTGGPGLPSDTDDYFIARHPVTCREYAAFLDDLARTEPDAARRRAPRESQTTGAYWPGPPFAVSAARRLVNSTADWEEDWPVFGVSWEDALACADWMRRRDGRCFTLPHELEWEKSGRGPDGRFLP